MITYWSVTSSWSILLSLSRVSEDSRLWCVFIPTAHLPLTLTSVLLSSAVTVCVYPTFIFEHEVTGLSFHTQLSTLAANWRKELLTPLLASNLFLVCICEFRSWLQKLGALSCEWLLMFGGILWLLIALGGFKRAGYVCLYSRKSFTWLCENVTENLLQSDVEYYCLTVIAACGVSNLISNFLFYLFHSNRSFYLSAFKSDRRKDFICRAHFLIPN